MRLHPKQFIEGIPTGNPHKGDVIIGGKSNFKEITSAFPRHSVFLKGGMRASFPTSQILKGEMNVYYDAGGHCKGVEIYRGICDGQQTLFWNEIDLLNSTLRELYNIFDGMGLHVDIADYGIEVQEIGISTFSSDFEKDLRIAIDSVYCKFGD